MVKPLTSDNPRLDGKPVKVSHIHRSWTFPATPKNQLIIRYNSRFYHTSAWILTAYPLLLVHVPHCSLSISELPDVSNFHLHSHAEKLQGEKNTLITTLCLQRPISPPKIQAKYTQIQLHSLTAPLSPCNITLLLLLSLLALSMRLFLFSTNPSLVYHFSISLLPILLVLSYSCPPVSPYPKQ